MKKIVLALFMTILTACSGVPVSIDYSQDFDFSTVATYAWMLDATGSDPEVDNDLVRQRVMAAIEAQFTAKGLEQVTEVSKASVLVSYQLGQEDKIAVDSFGSWYSPFAYYPCFRCGHRPRFGYFGYHQFYDDNFWLRNYQESTFAIDVLDSTSNKLLWRGMTKQLMPILDTPEERRLYVLEIVSAILAEFPPKLVSTP